MIPCGFFALISSIDENPSATSNCPNVSSNSKFFTKQIAFNAIPHIDSFLEDVYTKEEQKMHDEVKKILDNKIKITYKCVMLMVKLMIAVISDIHSNLEALNAVLEDLTV